MGVSVKAVVTLTSAGFILQGRSHRGTKSTFSLRLLRKTVRAVAHLSRFMKKIRSQSVPRPSDVSGPTLTRRDLLKRVLGFGAASACLSLADEGETHSQPAFDIAQPNAIRRENAKEGTRDWMLQLPRIDPTSRYRCPWIEGYCSRTSVAAGETISFHVSTNPASSFTIDLYRMGYYGGQGGRHLKRLGAFQGKVQPDPIVGPNRVRDCRWEPCASLTIPDDWLSGVYLGKLTAKEEGIQSYLIFVVRDRRKADFLFQCSDTTWQAYNRWPDHFALYDDGNDAWYWGPGVDVSFNRPYGKYLSDPGRALLDRIGRVVPLGISSRLLDGVKRL